LIVLPATNDVQKRVEERLEICELKGADLPMSMVDGQDVISGLTRFPKSLPPRYFYDDHGSQLFERICELPEYYPTRTESWILRQYAHDIAQMTGACELVELGSGSSTKTRQLLDAYQALGSGLGYVPIDVSGKILTDSARQLLQEYSALQIRGLVGTYEQALTQLQPTSLPARMLLFLGSTLGNLTPQECDRFFTQILAALDVGDYFLLGIDLQKPIQILEDAYNDAQGVTAQFNLNILAHLNHRFDGNFDQKYFKHWAFYNQKLHQIEMHLRCLQTHVIDLKALDLSVPLEAGETIQTEISRKFDLEEIQVELRAKGLNSLGLWTDLQQWFGLILTQKSCS
jgi:dimethylhistidine N-methyltransferase